MEATITGDHWLKIAAALDYYIGEGFQSISVPWDVCEESIQATLPEGICHTKAREGTSPEWHLVGSAEQSFIHLWMKDCLPLGKPLVAVSPCFRLSDNKSDTCHLPYFLKVELGFFENLHVEESQQWERMIKEASRFRLLLCRLLLKTYSCSEVKSSSLEPLPLEPSPPRKLDREKAISDLGINGIEIGSFGARRMTHQNKTLVWAYGTGLAEPRTSWAISNNNG